MNILFTCAGRRHYLLRYFKNVIGNNGKIIATDMQLSAPALNAADIKIQVPGVYESDYIKNILDICKSHDVRLLISLNDLELPILAAHKNEFEAMGVIMMVSDLHVIDLCFDKYKTARFVESLGLHTPITHISLQEAIRDLQEGRLQFPLVLKPRWGSGSICLEFVHDMDELTLMYAILKKKIRNSILATVSGNDDNLLIQEAINGLEYGLDIMNDLHGNNRGVSVKQKLSMRAGETDKAITVDNVELRELGAIIGNGLKHIGNLDCDILQRDSKYYVLELNPRFGGGYPFSHEAGVNMPLAMISWASGKDVDDSVFTPKYGQAFSKCDILLPVMNP